MVLVLVSPSNGNLPFLLLGICHCILKAYDFLFNFIEIQLSLTRVSEETLNLDSGITGRVRIEGGSLGS